MTPSPEEQESHFFCEVFGLLGDHAPAWHVLKRVDRVRDADQPTIGVFRRILSDSKIESIQIGQGLRTDINAKCHGFSKVAREPLAPVVLSLLRTLSCLDGSPPRFPPAPGGREAP